MNWYFKKKADVKSVIVASWSNEGIIAYIDNKRYYCPSFNPKRFALLNKLIKLKHFGKAAGLLRDWPCENQEIKK